MMECRSRYKRKLSQAWRQYWVAYLIFLPVMIWYAVFCYAPMGGLVIAFQKFSPLRGITNSAWVGLDNFRRLFEAPAFLKAVENTLIISLQNLLFCFPVPIVFALLLNELRALRFKRFVQTVSYLPHFISWSVTGGILYMVLSPSSGVIAALVTSIGGTPVNYLGSRSAFRSIVVLSSIWKSMGWGAIIYLAAITGVDEQLYEAAHMDGAGRFRCMWHITLPGMRSIIAFQLILSIGNILNVSFDQIFILVNTLTLDVGETIDYYIYRVGLSNANQFSLATAAGLVKSLIGFLLILITNSVSKRLTDGEGIW